MTARQTPESFWSKVDKGDGCWEWQRYRNPLGYGRTVAPGQPGRLVLAHRVSWELAIGPIPTGLHVLHHCDNPPCVRPDHLFLGTLKDNSQDAAKKGRLGQAGRKLTKERLREMGRRGAAALHAKHGADTAQKGRAVYLAKVRSGERLANTAKLTRDQVLEVRALYDARVSPTAIGRRYGLNRSTIHRIGSRRYYAYIPEAVS